MNQLQPTRRPQPFHIAYSTSKIKLIITSTQTKSTVCVKYDYVTVRNTAAAVVQFLRSSLKFCPYLYKQLKIAHSYKQSWGQTQKALAFLRV